MKKLFLVALSMLLMCMMVCNPYAAESVQEITKYDTASLRDFPDLVNDGTVEEHKLLERRHEDEKEAMNMLAYKKESGENVAFLYHFDVKYKDKNGNIKDKSKEIVRDGLFSTTSFKTKDNDILSYFSVNDDGNVEVKTVYGEYSIVSVIENRNKGNRITAERDTEDTLTYRNAVDKGIHLMYEAEYNGVKEYIVLDSNSGNKFTFTMDFVGLTPQLAADNSVLLLNADGETVLTIPPIYVEDSAVEKNSTYDNTVKLTQVKGNRYLLEITVDEDFLSSAETVYPVYVDPYIQRDSSNIEDTYVEEKNPDVNYGNSTTNKVGKTVTSKRTYTYIKFGSFTTTSMYHNVLSAYYETYEISNSNNVLVDVLPAAGSWTESTLTWNNQPGFHEEIIGKTAVIPDMNDYGTVGLHRFYISNLVRGWWQGLPNYGIVLRSNYNNRTAALASSENTSKASRLVIIYVERSEPNPFDEKKPFNYEPEHGLSVPSSGLYFLKNKRSGKYLTADVYNGGNAYQSDFTGSSNQKWYISQVEGTVYFTIRTENQNYSLDVYSGGINESNSASGNADGSNIQVFGNNSGNNQRWRFVRNWNGTYKILSALSTNRGLTVYNASNADNANCILYTHNVNFIYNDDWTIEPCSLTTANFFSFTETNDYGINTSDNADDAKTIANEMGFASSNNYINKSADFAFNLMSTSTLWFFRGHGSYSCLAFNDSTNPKKYIAASGPNTYNTKYITELDGNALQNMFLFATVSCYAGNSAESDCLDLIGLVYRKGAHFSFGTIVESYTLKNSLWTVTFMNSLENGKTYYQAIQIADNEVLSTYLYSEKALRSCARHYAGDSSIILYHPQ